MDLSQFFLKSSPPPSSLSGSYNWELVALSYLIATLASFVALDITERIRMSKETLANKMAWLIGGAIAMGLGIWSMHFIGMLAFVVPTSMDYDPFATVVSLVIAIIASGFAFFLIQNSAVKPLHLILGGILLGLGIASMHYVGMAAMLHMHIYYIPKIFLLSILIACAASEAALWLMIKSSSFINDRYHFLVKVGSALLMALAICGMHYTGMSAAVFVHDENDALKASALNLDTFSFYIALMTIVIMLIALAASKFWMKVLQSKNQKLLETEAILELKSKELQKSNQSLLRMAEISKDNEERILAILTAAADGIIVTGAQGQIELCNRAACSIFGYPKEEIVSQNVAEFIGFVDKKNSEFHEFTSNALCERQDEILEFAAKTKDNQLIPLELSISSSILKNHLMNIIVFRNISDRKESEKKMASLNAQLITMARLAGMAEVATSVLHNVGNVLNSINVSVQFLIERDIRSKLQGFSELSKLVNENKDHLDTFIKEHPIGLLLPEYLLEFNHFLDKEYELFMNELDSLNTKVHHIKSIIKMQQTFSRGNQPIENVEINKLLDESLSINSDILNNQIITVEKDYHSIPKVTIDKVKLLQALINLIKNGIEALMESKKEEKRLTLRTSINKQNEVQIEIIDNGIGIKDENLPKIFSYGFTTKEKGHGFGLHTSALSIHEIGGSLKVDSKGPDQGTAFVITLPIQPINIPKGE